MKRLVPDTHPDDCPGPLEQGGRGPSVPGRPQWRGWLVLAAGLLAMGLLSGCLAQNGTPSPGPAVTSWATVNTYFSGNTCQSCHPPQGSLATQQLDHYALLNDTGTCTTNGGKLVEPGHKELSCLWLSVTKQEGSDMLGAVFAGSVGDTIGAWIDDGAAGP